MGREADHCGYGTAGRELRSGAERGQESRRRPVSINPLMPPVGQCCRYMVHLFLHAVAIRLFTLMVRSRWLNPRWIRAEVPLKGAAPGDRAPVAISRRLWLRLFTLSLVGGALLVAIVIRRRSWWPSPTAQHL